MGPDPLKTQLCASHQGQFLAWNGLTDGDPWYVGAVFSTSPDEHSWSVNRPLCVLSGPTGWNTRLHLELHWKCLTLRVSLKYLKYAGRVLRYRGESGY